MIGLILAYVFINAIFLFNLSIDDMENGFNPIRVYKENNVNWFGCIMLVLLAHILFLPIAIIYWFYILCTYGRRQRVTDFYTAWDFLQGHKIFNDQFNCGLWTEVVKVDPKINAINFDVSKNTKVQIWLEHGPYDKEWGGCTHDLDLDCGGDTFEDAIIKLAELVKNKYGDERWEIGSFD